MRNVICFVAVGFLMSLAAPVPATDISVTVRNVEELRQAIETANTTMVPTNITPDGEFIFGPDDELPPIVGDVSISHPSSKPIFRPEGFDPDRNLAFGFRHHQLFRIGAGGRLSLDNLRIEGFGLSVLSGFAPDGLEPLIENHGTLVIRDVEFQKLIGSPGSGFCCREVQGPLIGNYGSLIIEQSSFLDVINSFFQGGVLINHAGTAELREVLTASRDPEFATMFGIANLGGLVRIVNSTLAAQENALFTAEGATTELVNTIIPKVTSIVGIGFADGSVKDAQACTGPVVSLGHNLVADESCMLDGPEDLQGIPTGTFPLMLLREAQGLVPVIRLAGASPAVDSADPAWCGRFDLLGTRRRTEDGNNDGIRVCDRGAVELSQQRLTDGGINGLFYVPDHDGHYISILDNPSNTLIIWNTFDRDGHQAWIYGIGEVVNGRSVIAEAYTNENGMLTDAGAVDIETAVPWGTLMIELDSCNDGTMLFSSSRPEFGSGEFRFRRLASTRQLGCSD